MSFIQKSVVIVAISTDGVGSAYSTDYVGRLDAVHVVVSSPTVSTTKSIVTITSDTTTRAIMRIANPSTSGIWYYRKIAVCGSSGASTGLKASIPLSHERIRVAVAATSQATATKTATVTVYIA